MNMVSGRNRRRRSSPPQNPRQQSKRRRLEQDQHIQQTVDNVINAVLDSDRSSSTSPPTDLGDSEDLPPLRPSPRTNTEYGAIVDVVTPPSNESEPAQVPEIAPDHGIGETDGTVPDDPGGSNDEPVTQPPINPSPQGTSRPASSNANGQARVEDRASAESANANPPTPQPPQPPVFSALEAAVAALSQKSSRKPEVGKVPDTSLLPDPTKPCDLARIGNVQLLRLADDQTRTYDAIDLSEGCFVVARRLEYKKHLRRLILAHRLKRDMENSEENRRNFELLVPSKTFFLFNKEKDDEKRDAADTRLFYYWFEPPHHGSLHAYVLEHKRLPEGQSKNYFRQICRLVEYCHDRGVIIRDLKLRKFVFADSERRMVKLDDLDETAICPENKGDIEEINWDYEDPDNDLLCDRHGCPAYVSPEILDLSKKWYSGKASDVWSLGVLLYVLLVGRYPFYDVTPAGLFSKIRQARIHLTDSDGVRLEARILIRTMLRRDPKERPTVTEVLSHPWLQPKDYRSQFKAFNSDDTVFWKPRIQPAAAAALEDGPSTSAGLIHASLLAPHRVVPESSIEAC